jgi:type I restriction enzyme, R subunit
MNESDTRAELIDPLLRLAGWGVVAESRIQREYNINNGEIKAGGIRSGKLKADYILIYKNRKLAVIEAKSDELEVGEGVAQAKQYATKLELAYSYATNGKEIYEICLAKGVEKEGLVSSFPTPDELWNRTFGDRNEWQAKFNAVPFEDVNGSKQARYYQELAVNRVMEAVANNKQRILLTLATGTGKTFISFQIAWKLFKARWNMRKDGQRTPRILFLADRNILANQAYLDFGAFEDSALVRISPSQIAKKGEVPKNGSVFFTIFQTFMSGAEGKPYFGDYEKDFFDFVIIDECHRGGANDESNWRDILNYFDSAVHLGLTATPKKVENANTYKYFGEPVYKYSLKEGIQDGFLTPFKVKRIQTTMDEYVYTPDDEVLDGSVEEGKVYTEADFNKKIVIEQRERKRVQEMLANINQKEKTLVFCANQAHAALVRDLINQEAKEKNTDYCVRVTANDGAIGDTYLKQFQDNDRTIPTIITTSQKLTTGVDARNVRNVVLMRPVNSMIEFKQIIGRGTRLFEGKHYFTIVDFVNAYHMFNDADWDGDAICEVCGNNPCSCNVVKRTPCKVCNQKPCVCEKGDGGDGGEGGQGGEPKERKLKIKLSDGKTREIQAMRSTMFYVDGKPISAEEFLQRLFNTLKLPQIFGSEDSLRTLWANPITRNELLKKLEHEGCAKDDLIKLQEMIEAENCDLFDVLEYISYARKPMTRSERVLGAQSNIYTFLNEKQRDFIAFILKNYEQDGVDELDIAKLSSALTSKYGGLHEAQKVLGDVDEIRNVFVDFQQHLYAVKVA